MWNGSLFLAGNVVMTLRIAVIGGGVAGGAIVSGLRDTPGIEISCIEPSGPDDHAHAGNGLNLGPNAITALAGTIPELAERLVNQGLPWTIWCAQLADQTPLYSIKLSEVTSRDGVRIRWSELYEAVRRDARDYIAFNTHCGNFSLQSDGRWSLETRADQDSDKKLTNLDLIIAADGRYSAIRESLMGAPQPRHRGIANFRALVDDDGTIAIDDMEQWFNGPRRLIAFRLPDGLIYVSGNLPISPGEDVPDHYRDPDFLRSAYSEGFANPDPRLLQLADVFAASASSMHWARAQEIEPCFEAAQGRVIFVGDASHGMCPTLGQGATQALEDAASVVELIRALPKETEASPAKIASAYSHLRRNRIDFVRQFSWDASDALVQGADPIQTNRAKQGADYRAKLSQLYNEIPSVADIGREKEPVKGARI